MGPDKAMQIVDMTKFYYAIGGLIVVNLGTLASVIWTILKAVWWLSKVDSQIKQNTKDINEAHEMIRGIRG